MKSLLSILACLLSLAAVAEAADETAALSLAEATPFQSPTISATGRILPVTSARIGARVNGFIAVFGTDESGKLLDVGMSVKKGQLLFSLNETTFQNMVGVQEAALKAAQANLANLTAATRAEKIEQLSQLVTELDARILDQQREVDRYRRLVENEKTLPQRRLEEAETQLRVLKAQHAVASARLKEAQNGPTPTEIAVAAAAVKQAEASLKVAQDDLRDSAVVAPFDGVISERYKSVGDYVANMPLVEVLELVAVDRVEADLRLPEAYFRCVTSGKTTVTLRSPLMNTEMTLPIDRVVNEIDSSRGTFTVRVSIPPEKRDGLVPGMFVTAEVTLNSVGKDVLIPVRALVHSNGKGVVFVAQDGVMRQRTVELGDRLTENVVVREGLAPGEKVIVGPAELLKDGVELPSELKGR
jgi:multidrug efflux pump subunit AcrA (membrane-fusion protein)